jgi:carbon monoxide dehydrogenase subunit G
MELVHDFSVPSGVDEAWRLLLDVERIAPCLPGATLDSVTEGQYTGRVKVKIGPIMLAYAGTAWIASADEERHRVVIEATGKETRGSGTAQMTVTAQLTAEEPALTRVVATTELAITGRPAQFGRGVMVDVGGKLLGQFADCLAARLSGEPAGASVGHPAGAAVAPATPAGGPAAQPSAAEAAGGPAGVPGPVSPAPAAGRESGADDRPTPDHIDLVAAAGGPLAVRAGPPLLGGLLLAALLWWLLRRRRHG